MAKGFWSSTIKYLVVVAGVGIIIGVLGRACSVVEETGAVAQKEFGPAAALKKYEWFKGAAEALEKKQADLKVYEQRLHDQAVAYKDVPRKDWPRDEREQRSIWLSEQAGLAASFNGLAAEYNAAQAKFNWQFANTLPREYKQYTTGLGSER